MSQSAGLRPFVRLPGGLAPLGFSSFALYWVGFAATNAGKWIENTGAVWVAYELTGSAFLLGLLGIVRAVPTIILTPFAGVIVDRVDQRRLVMITQALALVTSFVTGLLILTGQIELWQLYLEVGLQSAILAVDTTARQALFPRLVPRDHLVEAVTLTSAAARSSGLIGPAIGGVAIATLGNSAPFFLNAATFLLLMGALALMRVVLPVAARAGTTFRAELTEGFRYMLGEPVLNGLLKLEIVYAVFQMNPVLVTIVARESFDVGPEGLGILLSAIAGGALVGTGILIAAGPTNRPGRFVTVSAIVCAVAMLGFAAAHEFWLALIALVVTGVFDAMVSITRNSIAQLAAPARMRGRVMANQGTVVRGMGPLSQAQSGALAGLVGGPLAVIVAAAALGVSAAGVARANLALWEFDRRSVRGEE